jgi:D-glycero-D-manno-heptose 1,7-bisphosphate phosphatase
MVNQVRRRAVFVDRDGVINRAQVRDGKPWAPRSAAEFRLLPGVPAAVQRLRDAGFLVAVVTNQPDIGNGLVDESAVEQMHERLRSRVPVDDIRVCPHSQSAGCDCRKPKPGMLVAVAREHRIDLASSFMIGDRASDMIAGATAGCYTIFVERGYAEEARRPVRANATVRSLPEAVRYILQAIGDAPVTVAR